MITHGGVMALAAGGDPDRPVKGIGGLLESFQVWFDELKSHTRANLSEVEFLLKMVAEGFLKQEDLVTMSMYPRRIRWRNLAAQALLKLPDVGLSELEMAILCESDVRHQVWQAYVAKLNQLSTTPEGLELVRASLMRSTRQFHDCWRVKAAVELESRFPGS